MTIQKQEIGMVLSAILISATLSGCQSSGTANPPEADAAMIDMAPAQRPVADAVGSRVEVLRNNQPITYTVTAVSGETSSGTASDGCSYTELDWAYAPSLEWANCQGSTGTQTITKVKGSPWPMSVGTKFSYRFKGKDSNDNWSSTRKCTVSGTERVATQLGEFDTYKVECKDAWSKRTWWYAPEIARNVKSKRKHYRDASRNYEIETLSVTPGSY